MERKGIPDDVYTKLKKRGFTDKEIERRYGGIRDEN